MKNIMFTKHITEHIKDKNIYFLLFLLIEGGGLPVFFVYNLYTHGSSLNSMMLNAGSQFNDYFMHVGYASAPIGTNIYALSAGTSACFPPLAYVMYAILARLVGYYASNPADLLSHMYVGNNLTIYLIYSIMCIVLFSYAISLFLEKKGFINQVLFPYLLIVSYPFAFTSLQRGNSVMLVSILLCIAIIWRDDKSKVKQELAMLIIAVCAGLKIYPALFGLLYLKEKRYKQAGRLLLYGLILFFAPFIFFGGIEGIRSFANILLTLSGQVHYYSIQGLANALILKLFGNPYPTVSVVVQQLFLLISLIFFFLSKEKWGEILLLCGVMALYISSGWMYTCVYILPALLMFFKEKNSDFTKINLLDLIELLLFSVVFSIPFIDGTKAAIIVYWSILFLVIIYVFKTVLQIWKAQKGKPVNLGHA